MNKMQKYINALENVMRYLRKEQDKINNGYESIWTVDMLASVHSEINELLNYAHRGEIFFKFGKKQRRLQATYFLLDAYNDSLSQTDLGQSISELQKLYYHL